MESMRYGFSCKCESETNLFLFRFQRSDGKMAPFQVTFVVEIILGFFVYTTFSCLICLPFEVLLFKFFHSFYVKIKNENSAAKSASKGGNETAIVIDTELKVDNNQTY